jgi:hypothetical protein
MSPKGPCVEALVPNVAMFKDGTLGKGLDSEASDLINGLIHSWVHNLMGYQMGDNRNLRGGT